MLVKNPMIKNVITIDVNSPMLGSGNRRDPIMVCPGRPSLLKSIFSLNRPSRKKAKKTY